MTKPIVKTNVFDVLKKEGRSKTWLAGQVGISKQALRQIELGKIRIGAKFMQGTSQALGRTVEELFWTDEGGDAIRASIVVSTQEETHNT